MRAGFLRHRIDVQQASLAAADATGAQAQVWTTILLSVPANVTSITATENWRAKQIQPEATYLVSLRYNADITSACRFLWNAIYLYPLSVESDSRMSEMKCLCRTRG